MLSPVKIWRRQKVVREKLGKQGKILTWTKIFVTVESFKKQAPYPVVLVEFDDGSRAVGQLVDYKQEDLQRGRRVTAILRRLRDGGEESVIPYGLKFKP